MPKTLKKNVARFARRIVKWDFWGHFYNTVPLLFSLENQMVGRVLCFSHLMCLVWEWRQKSRESRHAVYPCLGNISWVTFKVLLERLQNLERFWHHFERTNKVVAAGVINSKWLKWGKANKRIQLSFLMTSSVHQGCHKEVLVLAIIDVKEGGAADWCLQEPIWHLSL